MTRNADFKRRVRERMARTGESYAAARTHLLPRTTLHVTNGDSTARTLAELGIDALPWRDALHEGPVGRGREARAQAMGAPLADFEARDERLDSHLGDYVLWFEADLYDQLQLAEILARLGHGEVTLVQVGEHLGIARFGGLGELTAEQLAALPRTRLTQEAFDVARQAWAALTAREPSGLLAVGRSGELRFMAEAFVRLAQEYPWRRDGLSLTERRLLAATGNRVERFLAAAAKEQRPFLGDTLAFKALERLAPLLEDSERREVVLRGEAQFITDRWIGGVHITPATPWRWDEAREGIISL